MSNRILRYGSTKNITVWIEPSGFNRSMVAENDFQTSQGGVVETIHHYSKERIALNLFFSTTAYHQMFAWWSWAQRGNTFKLLLDSTKNGNTTLDASATGGQRTIPVTSTPKFIAGDHVLIKSVTSSSGQFEVVKLSSKTTGVSLQAATNLVYTYLPGDVVRHLNYFPSLVCRSQEFKPRKDIGGSYYRVALEFEESS